ncbi:MAG TPA: threo-3-hydroxy-L-aspartate ammonia-lyase [Solirubrobacterales bacterium]|nr:threo-3-hydroxy-L-aspartate ammonia-lyase [Solirubrobacterales bacterium]
MTSETETLAISAGDVRAAAERLAGHAHRTPVLTSRTLDELVAAQVVLKAENFQRGGAFKFRGAFNAISRLDPEERARGVLSYSSGNHAQAIALGARLHDSHAVIVMPADAPTSKRAATEGYGAEVVTYDRYGEVREEIGERLARERGLTVIPPYDHPHVIAGQGTAALELIEDAGSLDAVVVPVSGGGLAAGTATIAKALAPDIEVHGVEPEAGDDTRRSFEAGQRVTIPVPRTIADGLATASPGELTFPINRTLLTGITTVSDEEIVAAMRFLFERMKIVVEPSGATALAALLSGRLRLGGARVGVILSGGNVDAARFGELLGRREPA